MQSSQGAGHSIPSPSGGNHGTLGSAVELAGQLINTITHQEMVPVGRRDLGELPVFVPCTVLCHTLTAMIKNDKC